MDDYTIPIVLSVFAILSLALLGYMIVTSGAHVIEAHGVKMVVPDSWIAAGIRGNNATGSIELENLGSVYKLEWSIGGQADIKTLVTETLGERRIKKWGEEGTWTLPGKQVEYHTADIESGNMTSTWLFTSWKCQSSERYARLSGIMRSNYQKGYVKDAISRTSC